MNFQITSLAGTPLTEGAAIGTSPLCKPQRSAVIGEVIPIVFGRRIDDIGGVFVSPPATEARFTNNEAGDITASYRLVISDGEIGSIQVRDVFQCSCRVGDHTQTYNQRAGNFTAGNFTTLTDVDVPSYCGTGGSYEGLSSIAFTNTIPAGFDQWRQQVHVFVRNGYKITRLLDNVFGSSNNVADLLLVLMKFTFRVNTAQIDTASFLAAAKFTDVNGLWCNVEENETRNLRDWMGSVLPYYLLRYANVNGKEGLRPLLPTLENGAIDIDPVSCLFTFTEEHIIPESFQITYTSLENRKPTCLLVLWRQQPDNDIDLIRSSEVRYYGEALNGPYEQHDISKYCTSENHAIKFGAFKLARRRYISHTLSITVKPSTYNAVLTQGDIIRVRLDIIPSIGASSLHQALYEIDSISRNVNGNIGLELTHFPTDNNFRSLVALDVYSAAGTGELLPTGISATTCDINSNTDTTIPADTSDGYNPGYGNNQPNIEATCRPRYGSTDPRSFFQIYGVAGSFCEYENGSDYMANGGSLITLPLGDETLDNQDAVPGVGGISPGGPIPGDVLTYPGCGCADSMIEWYRDGVLVGTSVSYTVTVEDMQHELIGVGVCAGIDTCETPPILVPFTPTAYTWWRFQGATGSPSEWFSTANYYGAWIGVQFFLPGNGPIPWFPGGGLITVAPPFTSAGGFLGSVKVLTISTDFVLGTFKSYYGGVGLGAPYDMGAGGTWQFTDDNTLLGPGDYAAAWAGTPNPNQ